MQGCWNLPTSGGQGPKWGAKRRNFKQKPLFSRNFGEILAKVLSPWFQQPCSQMINIEQQIQYVTIILPITAFGLWGWGRYRGWVTYFWWVGTWRSRRHRGHGAVIFYWMYFWAEYGLLEDLTACLLLIWVGDNLVLASRHRRGRRKRLLRLNNDMFFMSICP